MEQNKVQKRLYYIMEFSIQHKRYFKQGGRQGHKLFRNYCCCQIREDGDWSLASQLTSKWIPDELRSKSKITIVKVKENIVI